MPTMGVPSNYKSNAAFEGITMAEKKAPQGGGDDQPRVGESRQEFLNRLTGKKETSIFKDGKKHNQMGKDEFLKLLSHQMQNQDPFNPMEQNKMVGELAQFAQLEQLSGLNTKFDTMAGNVSAENKFYAASFLGRHVMTGGTTIKHQGEGTSSDINFKLDKEASKLLVRIFDKKNMMIGEIQRDNMGQGSQLVKWDGISLDKAPASKGDYTVQIIAYDKLNQTFPVQLKTSGQVTGVSFDNGETVLTIDGERKVFLRDVDNFAVDQMQMQKTAGVNPQVAAKAYGDMQGNRTEIPLPQMPEANGGMESENEEAADYGE